MKTVFISGNFNIIHPGHQRILKFASELGDKLIVGVNSDRIAGENCHIPQEYRLEGVQNNIFVSEAFLLDQEIEEYISESKPDLVVKGKEWEFKVNKEESALKEYGGKLIFSSGGPAYSSVELINKSNNLENIGDNSYFSEAYAQRHDFSRKELTNLLKKFENLRVCVIGDLIVDEYIACIPLGMSQEDPTLVVSPSDRAKFIGGAGIVALHAAGLGAKVDFLSVIGNDNERDYILEKLKAGNVTSTISVDEKRHTTLKQRYQAEGKSLLRVSNLTQDSIDEKTQNYLLEAFEKISSDLDLVVFSDFNYGCLPQALVDKITTRCQDKSIVMVADSQSSSQVGDISRFKEMNTIFATEREARISLMNSQDGLVVLAEKLRLQSNAKSVFLKLGSEGLLLHVPSKENSDEYITDRLDASNSSPKDTAGAGDSMLITAALSLALGDFHWEAACLGNIAAGIQVSRVGNIPLSQKEFIMAINK